jgi:hypothetical protein
LTQVDGGAASGEFGSGHRRHYGDARGELKGAGRAASCAVRCQLRSLKYRDLRPYSPPISCRFTGKIDAF